MLWIKYILAKYVHIVIVIIFRNVFFQCFRLLLLGPVKEF